MRSSMGSNESCAALDLSFERAGSSSLPMSNGLEGLRGRLVMLDVHQQTLKRFPVDSSPNENIIRTSEPP